MLKDFIGRPEHTKIDPDAPLAAQTRVVRIGGRRFELPIMYLASPLEAGEEQSALLFEVIWPDMRSVYHITSREEYERIRSQEHRIGWILIEPKSEKPSLEAQHNNSTLHLTKLVSAGVYEGMEKSLWYRGLQDSPRLWAEVYIERSQQNTVIGAIKCSRTASSRYPNCEQRFVDGGLLYKITYNEAAFLPEWQQQRLRTIDFMRQFELRDNP